MHAVFKYQAPSVKTSTHIRLANLVAKELGIRLDSNECAYLRGGSIEPDKWKDYPHHHAVDHKIREYILKSRRYFIQSNINAHLECLGIAFHYVADKWTLFSGSVVEHAAWEKKIDKCNVSDLDQILSLNLLPHPDIQQQYRAMSEELRSAPRSKNGTLKYAYWNRPRTNQTAYSSPDIDFNIAFRICLGIGMSVRSMTTPPNELMKALNLLIPWANSKELSVRSPPNELEGYFYDSLSRFQLVEQGLLEKRENLKKKHGSALRTMLVNLRTRFSILSSKWDVWRAKANFNSQVEGFINEYKEHADWYCWGSLGASNIWRLKSLFKQNENVDHAVSRATINRQIQDRTFNEIVELKKEGFQLVPSGINFTISTTFNNPTSFEVENATLRVHAPAGWKTEIEPYFFIIPANGAVTPTAKAQIPPEDKLGSYLIEVRFLLPPSAPRISFTADRSSLIKVAVITQKIRKEWAQESIDGNFCGVLGCNKQQLNWKCPKCNRYFCDAHKDHLEEEQTTRRL